MKKILTAAITAALLCGAAAAFAAPAQTVTKAVDSQTVTAAAKNFQGTAYATSLFKPNENSSVYGALVTFTPGARTNWHIHARQQTLIVTEGVGYTQEWGKPVTVLLPGDVVQCPAGVKHWHGASANASMSHIAISEASAEGVTWLKPVSDEEYAKLAVK